jgi:hypothetical protein
MFVLTNPFAGVNEVAACLSMGILSRQGFLFFAKPGEHRLPGWGKKWMN